MPVAQSCTLTATERKALPLLMEGKNTVETARALGQTHQNISKIARKDNIRELVQKAQEQLIQENLSKVLENQKRKVEIAHGILNDETRTAKDYNEAKTILELADKVEQRIGQGVGIFPAHTRSQVFIQINDGGQPMAPEVLNLLKLHAQYNDDVIDIDLDIPDPGNIAKVEEIDSDGMDG
jgi:hypothetical protein